MARRVEGLSSTDLKVMALIDTSLATITEFSTDEDYSGERPFVTAISIKESPQNKWHLTKIEIRESLIDLWGRGFLIPDEATRVGKSGGYYYASQAFLELMARARGCIKGNNVEAE